MRPMCFRGWYATERNDILFNFDVGLVQTFFHLAFLMVNADIL